MTEGPSQVIDCYVRHAWASQAELMEYLPQAWREYLGRPDSLPGGAGAMPAFPAESYRNPLGERAAAAYPADGRPAGSDYGTLRAQVLDAGGVAWTVLAFDAGMLIPALPNHYLALELSKAANAWSLERWLDGRDDRLYGLILAPNQFPEEAAAEVRRLGPNSRLVGVLMGGNGIGKPFGHPLYHPIYAAATESGLPLVIAAGGEATPDTLTHTAAGGLPSTYAEYRVLAAQPLMTHLVSLVTQGVFEKFPDLQVLAVGAGATWLPGLIWRFDTEYKTLRREAPWMKQLPSEYFRKHIRVATYPLHTDAVGEAAARVLTSLEGIEDLLLYASGYPGWDGDTPDAAVRALPRSWLRKVLFDNADSLFSRAGGRRTPTQGARDVGRMDGG